MLFCCVLPVVDSIIRVLLYLEWYYMILAMRNHLGMSFHESQCIVLPRMSVWKTYRMRNIKRSPLKKNVDQPIIVAFPTPENTFSKKDLLSGPRGRIKWSFSPFIEATTWLKQTAQTKKELTDSPRTDAHRKMSRQTRNCRLSDVLLNLSLKATQNARTTFCCSL